MEKDAVTIYDIAAEAGVSAATVSRVMNNNGYVGKDTRKKVEDVIEKYRFKPNAIAQGLTNKHSRTIGMLVPDVRNPYYAAMFVHIEEAALKFGYNVILCNTLNNIEKDYANIEMLLQKQIDVLIPLGGQIDEVKPDKKYMQLLTEASEKIPVLSTGMAEGHKRLNLAIDDSEAIKEVIHTMIKKGHKRFAMIGGMSSVIPSRNKHQCFSQVLRKYKIPAADRIVLKNYGYDVSGGREGVRLLKEQGPLPTVIFGINEFVTTGIMMELQSMGRMDGSIEVIGFDNTYLTELSNPTMTCIGVDYSEYAQKAIDMIRHCLNEEPFEHNETVKSLLTIRESACT